jgi:hypothetical protein
MLSCYASQVIKRLKIYLPRPNLDPNNFALQKCVIGMKKCNSENQHHSIFRSIFTKACIRAKFTVSFREPLKEQLLKLQLIQQIYLYQCEESFTIFTISCFNLI